ncbi:S8 family serine peptidase [Nonomuraea sp. LPB2021202275-12-8]|uniref:S8 family serine peptidase n=1 Tax=Nonomuraea sp. LPB2021202275-12-8 TaxID=3120159 RepID=UPI00300CF36E
MPLSLRRPHGQRLLPAALLALGLLAAMSPTARAADEPPTSPKIDSGLAGKLSSAGARIEAAVVLRTLPAARARPAEMRTAPTRTAESVQSPMVELVESRGDQVVNTFWLKNMVLVRATPATLEALAALDLVDRIIPNFELGLPRTPKSQARPSAAAEKATWGVTKIGADRVQAETGLTGSGVRVAVLDTGVDITHPDLAGKLASDDASDPAHPGGWIEFGPDGKPVPSTPHDSSYHGTHVAGTVAGGNTSGTQIGVAPGAELMAGLVIPHGSGTLAQVIAGMEWALAPYAADGTPAGRPADVISMSLGSIGYASELVEPARNIYLTGAFPSFAIGNDCPPGASAGPGNVYEAVSVGATDADDGVPDFSCGGTVNRTDWLDPPAEWPDTYVVPDVSAPGVDVLSTMPGGGYEYLNGTSMATPHVSGTVALMLQARPDLTVDGALEILTGTSLRDERYGTLPNPRHGHGRIDAYAAVTEAGLKSGVRGTVLDERNREPLAGVAVTRADGRSVTTGQDGRFELRLPAGRHDLKLSRFGYRPETAGVRVQADRFSDVRPALARTRWGAVSGRVVYGPTGSTVPGATVTVLDVPDPLTARTDRHGRYRIEDVPEGDYKITASAAGVSRSDPAGVSVDGRKGHGSANLTLPRPPGTERVSLGSDGRQGNDEAWWPELSQDGAVAVFASPASNFADGDTNGDLDVFATDLRTRTTTRVSVSSAGEQSNGFSLSPTVSADGRFVGFNSGATNLVTGDTNGQTDGFVHDRQTGRTERVSVASDGVQGDGLSAAPSLSADGRFAVFNSDSANLVPGDTNGRTDVFVHDRQTGKTERISLGRDGAQGDAASREESISADGRFVAFQSDAANLVPEDVNGLTDVFVRDLLSGTTKRVAAPHPTETRGPRISADGRTVVFSNGVGLGHLYAHDLRTGANELVSATPAGGEANGMFFAPSLSADGRTVAFYSEASDLVAGDTGTGFDVFVRDLDTRITERISAGSKGAETDGWSELPSISGDGRYVVFQSSATNLVEGDTNRRADIFVHDRVAGPEPRFVLSDLEIKPAVARPGRSVRVEAWVKNVGEQTGSYDAVLRVNGEADEQRNVRLRTDQDVRVSFDVRRSAQGTYVVELGSLTGEFRIGR